MVILNERMVKTDDLGLEELIEEDTPKSTDLKPTFADGQSNVAAAVDEEKTPLVYLTNYVVPELVFEVIYTPRIELKKPKKEDNGNKLFDSSKLHNEIYRWFEKKGVFRNLKVYMKSPYQRIIELLWYKDNPSDWAFDKRFRVYGKIKV